MRASFPPRLRFGPFGRHFAGETEAPAAAARAHADRARAQHHIEIHCGDFDRAERFYTEVFGWRLERWEGSPIDYRLITTGSDEEPGINGALVERRGPVDGSSVSAYVCTVQVEDLAETERRMAAAGGERAVEPNEIPGVGTVTSLKDSEGNILGALQPAQLRVADVSSAPVLYHSRSRGARRATGSGTQEVVGDPRARSEHRGGAGLARLPGTVAATDAGAVATRDAPALAEPGADAPWAPGFGAPNVGDRPLAVAVAG